MKKVAIVGLGWLGMPLARALSARGWAVSGTKTTKDGVQAARNSGIEAKRLDLDPEIHCDAEDLAELLNADALIITLPARRTVDTSEQYIRAVENIVDMALARHIPRILFTSSTSVYGEAIGICDETTVLDPVTPAGKSLVKLEQWLHDLPGTSVDILRLAGLVGPGRHPGRFLAGKTGLNHGQQAVNLVHLDDVIAAIVLLLEEPSAATTYNLCAPGHPSREAFYTRLTQQAGWQTPRFDGPDQQERGKQVSGERICQQRNFRYQWPDPYEMPFVS
ncbi:SDR family oxidoreductase [Tatumella saanichensis]|uniref:SDR family oxidoreductase n=1 Tax=Tatumella saanichensis TaxID=480813 RepID=UPI0004A33A02|nr:SDR family oxidoreductase [Tatumella saanichensis]